MVVEEKYMWVVPGWVTTCIVVAISEYSNKCVCVASTGLCSCVMSSLNINKKQIVPDAVAV